MLVFTAAKIRVGKLITLLRCDFMYYSYLQTQAWYVDRPWSDVYTLVICVDPDQMNKPCWVVNYNQIWKLNLVNSIDPGQSGESDRFCKPWSECKH